MEKLWANIEQGIGSAVAGLENCIEIVGYDASPDNRNEAVFFLKPELAIPAKVNFSALSEIIVGAFDRFDVEVMAAKVMSGKFLEEHDIMARHYGAINLVSRLGIEALTSAARDELERCFPSNGFGEHQILGGHQVIEWAEGRVDAAGLERMWEKTPGQQRLAPGVYANRFSLFDQDIVILNGFHPHQLHYFTGDGKAIAVMVVRTPSSWKSLRNQLIGATDPNKAEVGSIRRLLLENASKIGVDSISKGKNGVHLSAGPLEAFFEIERFFDGTDEFLLHSNLVAAADQAALSKEILQGLSGNPSGLFGGGEQSVFDVTEELDMQDVIDLMRAEFEGRA